MGRALVVIPALNEEGSIRSVVEEVHAVLDADVVVIDDGSSDATGQIALEAGAIVLPLPFNVGVGGAIHTGLLFARERGYEYLVQIDADGQHDPREAKRLLDELKYRGLDLLIGSRFAAGYPVSVWRRTAMQVIAWIVSRRLETRVTDATSGFRAMGPRAIQVFAGEYPQDYLSDTVEALLLAATAGLRVGELDVKMHSRQAGIPSSSRIRSTYHLLRLFLILVLDLIRRSRHSRSGDGR